MDSAKQLAFSLSPARSVYRPSPKRYLKFEVLSSGVFPVVGFGLLFLVIVLSPLWNGHPEQLSVALPIGLVVFGPLEYFFVYYLLWRTHLRLVLSGEGIEYATAGYRIFTPWGNVAGFGTRQEVFQSARGPGWTLEIGGLELHQPAPVYKARPLVRLFMRLHSIERPSLFIPLSTVMENNWQDNVAADIQRYAPQTAKMMPYFRGANSPYAKTLLQREDIEGLITALTDLADEVRESAAIALGYCGDARAVAPLIAVLQDTVYRVRKAAADALAYLGDARAIDPLIQVLLHDSDLTMIEGTAKALGQIGDVRAVERLSTIAQNSGLNPNQDNHDPISIQMRIVVALNILRKKNAYNENIQKAAASALKQLKSSKQKSR